MAGRIREGVRAVGGVSVAVQRLRIYGIGNDGIRLDESAELGIVIAGLEEVQTGFVVEFLAGVAVGEGEGGGAGSDALLAVGGVFVLLDDDAVAVGDDVRGAE